MTGARSTRHLAMARICGVPQVRAIDFFGMHMARTTCHCRRLALAARCRPAAATGLIVCPRKVIMVRSRTAQLIFQSFYVAIGLVGIVGSLGFYEHSFDDVFYVYFTNLSNYLCIAVMLLELIQTAQRKADGFVTLSPAVKFISVTAILLTFFVFNILLAGAPDRDPAQNFTITSISFHVVLPLLFVFDWILFYEHGRVKWTYPLYSTIFPSCIWRSSTSVHGWWDSTSTCPSSILTSSSTLTSRVWRALYAGGHPACRVHRARLCADGHRPRTRLVQAQRPH